MINENEMKRTVVDDKIVLSSPEYVPATHFGRFSKCNTSSPYPYPAFLLEL
jgi:hypothetical protein